MVDHINGDAASAPPLGQQTLNDVILLKEIQNHDLFQPH